MTHLKYLPVFILFVLLQSCQKEVLNEKTGPDTSINPALESEEIIRNYDTSLLSSSAEKNATSNATLTPHFQTWLSANGYGAYNFSNSSITGDSYGGKTSNNTAVNNQPVIFIHGNSDKAVGTTFGQSGWTESLNYFLNNGYNQNHSI